MVNNRTRGGVTATRGSGSRRLRTALACNSCRARKTKCNGARPVCDVCERMGFDCRYTVSAHGAASDSMRSQIEQSRHTEERLNALEDLLRQAIAGNIIGSEQESASPADCHSASFNAMDTQCSPPDHQRQSVANASNPNGLEHDVVTVTPEADHGTGDTVDGMGIVTFADETTSGSFGPTSNSALIQHIMNALRQRLQATTSGGPVSATYGYDSISSISRPASPHNRSSSDGSKARSRPNVKTDAFFIPTEPIMSKLMNHFFREIGFMFPYVHEESIMNELARIKTHGPYGVRRSWLCLVDTIMAFSSHKRHDGEQEFHTGGQQDVNKYTQDSEIYLARALSLLPDLVFQTANLEILQALLVLTQYMQGTKFSSSTWSFQRLSMQAAIQIGVHIPTPERFTPLEQEIRNRCWHMCVILDRTCSMTFGRPLSIMSDKARVPLPQEHGFSSHLEVQVEETTTQSPSLNVMAYTQSIKLYRILGQIIDKVYQGNYSTAQYLSYDAVASSVFIEETNLRNWITHLPSPLHLVNRENTANSVASPELAFSLSLMLTLRYLNARILLHRSIVESCFVQTQICHGSEWKGLDVYGKESIKIALESASDMIDMISNMTGSKTQSFTTIWFLIYYVFNSAVVIFAIAALSATSSTPQFLSGQDLLFKLKTAQNTLDHLGNHTRISVRCRKYLVRLIEMASTIDNVNHTMPLADNEALGFPHFTAQGMDSALDLDSQILMPSGIDYLAFADDFFLG